MKLPFVLIEVFEDITDYLETLLLHASTSNDMYKHELFDEQNNLVLTINLQ